MKTTEPPIDLTCLYCGRKNEVSTSTGNDATPNDGDLSMCIECGAITFFDFTTGKLREPSQAEMIKLLKDREVQRVLFAWKLAIKTRPM
jgi:hypothetical protein